MVTWGVRTLSGLPSRPLGSLATLLHLAQTMEESGRKEETIWAHLAQVSRLWGPREVTGTSGNSDSEAQKI